MDELQEAALQGRIEAVARVAAFMLAGHFKGLADAERRVATEALLHLFLPPEPDPAGVDRRAQARPRAARGMLELIVDETIRFAEPPERRGR